MIKPTHVLIGTALCCWAALGARPAAAQAPEDPAEPVPLDESRPPGEPVPLDAPIPPPEPAPPATDSSQLAPAEPERAPRIWNVGLGVGVTRFSGSIANDAVDIGPTYELRVGVMLTPMLGFEAAYVGSSQSINALGLDPSADLRSNSLEILARFDLQSMLAAQLGPVRLSPFLFAGLAAQRYSLADEGINTSNVANDDNVIAIPFGGGVGGMWGRVIMDARLAWRSTYDEDLFRAPNGQSANASLSHWNLTARAGLAF